MTRSRLKCLENQPDVSLFHKMLVLWKLAGFSSYIWNAGSGMNVIQQLGSGMVYHSQNIPCWWNEKIGLILKGKTVSLENSLKFLNERNIA